jgi:branched-chain amino acid transport system permease protein
LILVFVLITAFFLNRLKRSRVGRAWVAIREDELASSCMGINTTYYKLIAMAVGASVAGVAGCFFAAKQGAITPDSFDFIVSVMVVAMVVLGGMGTLRGVILGGVLLSILPELFRNFQSYRMLIFGLAMILIMLFRPQGLIGDVQHKEELANG